MKQKMMIIMSLGNTVVLPHLQYCTHLKNTELEVMQRRANRMEWLSAKRHLMTIFWLAEVIEEDMNGTEKTNGG